ncbi:MAG: hypothetical protein L0Y35_04060 [Flammeovirgaceae bacterium]|nr:hypothetical protein [Flammeovirgaceae bacterium]
MEILVFKTSVDSADRVKMLKPALDLAVGKGQWNFALDDRDKILRVVSSTANPQTTISLLIENGFKCSELTD